MGLQTATPPCRAISAATQPIRRMLVSRSGLGEGQPGRQVPPYDVAVEAGDAALALLEQPVHQRAGERRLAAAGQAGEEEHQPLSLGRRLVALDDRGDLVGQVAPVDEAEHRVAGGVGRHDLGAERVVVVGVAVRGQRDDDDVGALERGGRRERGPEQADRGAARGCRRRRGRAGRRGPRPRRSSSWASVSASATGTNVRPAYCSRTCGGREVAAGGTGRTAAWVSGLDGHPAGSPADASQRQALGVDQLDRVRVGRARRGRVRVSGLPGSLKRVGRGERRR